jgi:hypothetical protein
MVSKNGVVRRATVVAIGTISRPDISFEQVHKTVRAVILQTRHDDWGSSPGAIFGVIIKKGVDRCPINNKLARRLIRNIINEQPVTGSISYAEHHSLCRFWVWHDIVDIASPDFRLNAVIDLDMASVTFWTVSALYVLEPTPIC